MIARVRAWQAANPEQVKAQAARRRARNHASYAERARVHRKENWAAVAIRDARRRARLKGIAFSITAADIPVPARCPVLDIEMVPGGDAFWNSPSIDRVDNSKGYIAGNVRVISRKANSLKGDATIEDLEKVIAYMREALDVKSF
jgi:hypothetical protein